MIKLIVGLGNPGQQYEKTRHNAGFLFLDHLLEDGSESWVKESKFHGLIANVHINGCKVLLLKPQTFMNRSGQAVAAAVRYYKIQEDEILVVHDELDFEPGAVKLKKNGGHAGHNGLRDIISHLGGNGFFRLRLGIGRPNPGKPVADYVLSNPSKQELELMLSAMAIVDKEMNGIVAGKIAEAMNALN